MTVLVRAAQPDDYAEIGRLTVAAYRESGQLSDESGGYASLLADVAARAAEAALLVAVDEATGRVLGAVALVFPGSRYAELARPGEAEFRMLAVDPAAQGRGVGRALVRACLARAVEHGCVAVLLCYRDFVAAAARLYAAMGFERLPERDSTPLPGVDLLAMRLALPRSDLGNVDAADASTVQ